MLKITNEKDLVEFFNKYKSPAKVEVVAVTSQKMNKKDVATKTEANPFTSISKITNFEAEVNVDYEDRVNHQRIAEGKEMDFEAANARWGTPISKAITEKDGKFYLKLIPGIRLNDTYYQDQDGKRVLQEEFIRFVPVSKPSGSGRQEVDQAVVFRTYKLDSIIGLTIPGIMEYVHQTF